MLIRAESSMLLVVDVQDRLAKAVPEGERVIENCAWLMEIATKLSVPILVSEQYPDGLGHTVARLAKLVEKNAVVEKVHFSCAAAPSCRERIKELGRPQIMIAGMESHVCVLQSALELGHAGYNVFVVADAVASIHAGDRDLAFKRLRDEGVRLVSRSMVAFEWLHKADSEMFRDISLHYLR